jgi:hypothetical protein
MIHIRLSKLHIFYIFLIIIMTLIYFISTVNNLKEQNDNLCDKLSYMYKLVEISSEQKSGMTPKP